MIVDGGSKTFSSDRTSAPKLSFGRVTEAPECVLHNLMEEHGFVDISAAKRQFSVGDRVRIIPNHVCVAVNLHEQVYGIRGDRLEQTGEWKGEASCNSRLALPIVQQPKNSGQPAYIVTLSTVSMSPSTLPEMVTLWPAWPFSLAWSATL